MGNGKVKLWINITSYYHFVLLKEKVTAKSLPFLSSPIASKNSTCPLTEV